MTPLDMMVVDANAEALGIPRTSLMENAGSGLAQRIMNISKPCHVAIYSGNGGNGGDGFVTARYLLKHDFEVEVYLLSHPSRIRSTESRINWEVLQKIKSGGLAKLDLHIVTDSSQLKDNHAPIIIDAILGTGIQGKLREPISKAISIINKSSGYKIAVDVPSGLDPLTGQVFDKAVKADLTFSLHAIKLGVAKADAEFTGKIERYDIGIPLEAEIFMGPGDLLRLKKRDKDTHKGQNGKLLVLGGSSHYSGAPALAGLSALKSGVDICIIASPGAVAPVIRSFSPDLIVRSLSEDFITPNDVDQVLEISSHMNAIVMGCGMGENVETSQSITHLIKKLEIPIVIDADALRMLELDIITECDQEIVMTPHLSEFKSLFGYEVPFELKRRIEIVNSAAQEFKCTIILKGSVDIISDGHKTRLNSSGNPGMTVGGTGDCLAGLVGSLIAQGHNGYEAACLGAYINGRAGDMALRDYGYDYTASEIIDYIPKIKK